MNELHHNALSLQADAVSSLQHPRTPLANARQRSAHFGLTEQMRRVLILGGTAWLGGEIAARLRKERTEVTCLARGEAGSAPAGVKLIRADRAIPGAYDEVASMQWDEVIEITRIPQFAAEALAALANTARHWTLVSTISVYADNDEPGADESAKLVKPNDLAQYPDAKVAIERASIDHVGDRLLIARAGLIVGPGDPTDRFGYWPARLHRGGRVAAPSPQERFVQVIDVADLAQWVVSAGRAGLTGTFNAVGEPHTMEEFFRLATRACAFEGELVPFDDETLLANDINYWAGERSLPLWLPQDAFGFMQRSNAAFRRAGGVLRPLEETITRTLHDEIERGVHRMRQAGLTPAEEEALFDAGGTAPR